MEDQSHGNADKERSRQRPDDTVHPVDPQQVVPPIPASGVADTGDPAVHEVKRETGIDQPLQPSPGPSPVVVNVIPQPAESNKWMNWLTAIIATATVVNIFIFYRESESTSAQIDILAAKAKVMVNQVLADNRTAVTDTLRDNRNELAQLLSQNRMALNASISQGNQSLEWSQRPWITESVRIGGPVLFSVNGASITIDFTLDNVGHSPAEQVWIEGHIVNSMYRGMPTRADQQRICGQSAIRTGEIVFPVSHPQQSGWTYTIPWEQITNTRTPGIIAPVVYGCVVYSYGLSAVRHFTPFRYSVVQSDGRALVQEGGFNATTKEIPRSLLGLRRDAILGQPAPN